MQELRRKCRRWNQLHRKGAAVLASAVNLRLLAANAKEPEKLGTALRNIHGINDLIQDAYCSRFNSAVKTLAAILDDLVSPFFSYSNIEQEGLLVEFREHPLENLVFKGPDAIREQDVPIGGRIENWGILETGAFDNATNHYTGFMNQCKQW